MPAQKSTRFVALFVAVAVVIALVTWLAFGVGQRKSTDAAGISNEHTEAAHTGTSEKPELAEAPAVKSTEKSTRATAPLVRAQEGDSGPTEAELASAWWVHGRVTYPDGTPADERAFVVAQGKEFGKKKLFKVAVAPDGTFRVAFHEKTTKGTLRIDARYVFLSEAASVKKADAETEVVLKPALGGALKGRVVPTAAAQPFVADIVGATVTATGWKSGMSGPRVLTATVSETLDFELGGLDPAMQWGVVCQPKGFATTYFQRPAIVVGKQTPFDLALQRGASVTGTVRDAAGAPLEGAQMQTDGHAWDGMGMPSSVTSDKNGEFKLEGVSAGKFRLKVRKSTFLPVKLDEIEVTDGGTQSGLAIVLQRGSSVSGVVHWPDGKPANGVRIEVQEPPEANEMRFYGFGDESTGAKSAGDGTFAITGLRPGPYTLTARSSPKEVEATDAAAKKDKRSPKVRFQARVEGVQTNATGVVLVLESGNTVQGRVHDDRGALAADFTVKAEPVLEEGQAWGSRGNDMSRDFSDAAGAFVLYGLSDGEWKVHVETKNGPKSETVNLVLPKDEKVLDFVLARAATLRGVVLDAGGAPVSGATVEARVAGAERVWSNRTPDKSRITRDDGTFESEVSPGALSVYAKHVGFAPSERASVQIAPAQSGGPVTLVLRKGARISGEVRDKSGKLDAGRTVSIWDSGYEDSQQATTDATGAFVMEHAIPGKVTLNLQPSQAEMEANRGENGSYSWSSGHSFNSQVELTLEEGGNVHVSLGGAPANPVRVFGIVRASEPLKGVNISFSRRDPENRYGNQRDATTDSDGRYELTVDAPGDYSVNFHSGKGGNAWMQCTVPPESSFELNATLPVGRLSGHVLTDAGKPLANVRVVAQSSQKHTGQPGELSTGFGNAESSSDGSFEIEMLSAGSYRLTAQPRTWGQATAQTKTAGTGVLEGVELAEAGNVTDLVIRMPRAGSVHGVVNGPNGPVAGANVTATSKDQGMFGHSDMTDESGRYEIDGLNPGSVVLVANSESAASRRSEPVEIRADESAELDLRLEPAGKIHIVVQDASGKTVQKPWNVLDDHGRDARLYPMDWANGEGGDKGWTIGPMPVGSYTVRIVTDHAGEESETRIDRHVDLASGATENVVVQLP